MEMKSEILMKSWNLLINTITKDHRLIVLCIYSMIWVVIQKPQKQRVSINLPMIRAEYEAKLIYKIDLANFWVKIHKFAIV